jgi:glycosyltransferase involved in cell wall biosynthesis
MLSGRQILCFGPSDWWSMNPSCTTHIMCRLAHANRVLYVNPFSSDLRAATGSGQRRGLGTRIARKLKSLTRGLRKPAEHLYVFSPLFVPIQGRRVLDAFNDFCLRSQIRGVCRLLRFDRPILWLENVRAADALSWFRPSMTVYHISDLFATDSYTSNVRRQEAREQRISAGSDLLICVSRDLYELKRRRRDDVHYLPHGVDFELFRQAAEREAPLPEIAHIPRPIAGYFGTMTAHNDIEMMTYCARNLPGVSFVFAGQVTAGDYAELSSVKNVHLLGRLPYEKIPRLCAGFDVCMLQWKMSDWIRTCNPLKMLEYMASGRPIVSVEINEARQYADVISIAGNKEEFCRAIEWELHNDTPERKAKRIEMAASHSWSRHVERLSELIEGTIRRKQGRTE